MDFKLSYSFPVILIALALASVFFLTEIEPFNWVISAIVFVIAAVMVWKVYYDFTSTPQKQETEYIPSTNVNEMLKDSPKESKIKLEDFLKSSPKDLESKEFNSKSDFGLDSDEVFSDSGNKNETDPFSDQGFEDEKYKEMKKKALSELKDIIKPTKTTKPIKQKKQTKK